MEIQVESTGSQKLSGYLLRQHHRHSTLLVQIEATCLHMGESKQEIRVLCNVKSLQSGRYMDQKSIWGIAQHENQPHMGYNVIRTRSSAV